MKKIYICLFFAITFSYQVFAQESKHQNSVTNNVDSLQTMVNTLNERIQSIEDEELNRAIWKKRSKYFNIGYVKQDLKDNDSGDKLSSDFGVSLSWGKSYYLHKKPIAGLIKIGLDWSWLDINYTKYSPQEFGNDSYLSSSDFNVNQIEIGMQLGPSITINPVHHLKVSAYFRATPSLSLLVTEDTEHYHYVTFCNTGLSVAWKVLSLGVEWRTGSAVYDGITLEDSEYDDYDDYWENDYTVDDIFKDVEKRKFNTGSFRFYFGFRF